MMLQPEKQGFPSSQRQPHQPRMYECVTQPSANARGSPDHDLHTAHATYLYPHIALGGVHASKLLLALNPRLQEKH